MDSEQQTKRTIQKDNIDKKMEEWKTETSKDRCEDSEGMKVRTFLWESQHVNVCMGKMLLWNIQYDGRIIEDKSLPWREKREEREGRRSREEEEKGAVIEVLDKNHKDGDHFNREVSAVKLCVGMSGPSIYKQCVGILLTPYSIQYTCGADWRWACVQCSPGVQF